MPIGPRYGSGSGGGDGEFEGVSAAVDLLADGATDREGIEIGLLTEDAGADWSLIGVQRQLAVRASATVGTGANTVTITLPPTLVDEAGGNDWSIRLLASGTAQVAANVGADLANTISVYVSNTGITLNQIKSLIVAASVLTDSDIVVAGNGGTIIPRPSSTQTTNFSGGIAEEPLAENVDAGALAYKIRYNNTTDILSDLVALINAGDNAEATLIAGTDDTDHPETASGLNRPFEGRRGAHGPRGEVGEGRRLDIDPSGSNNRTIQLPANFATYDHGIIEWVDGGNYVEMSFDIESLPATGTKVFRSGGSLRATFTAATSAFTLSGSSFSGAHLYDAGVSSGGGSGTGGAGVDQTARDAAEQARALAETARQDVGVNAGLISELQTRRRARIVYESVNSAGAFADVDTTGGDIYVVRVAGTPGTGQPWNDNSGFTRHSGDVLLWYNTGGYWVEINESKDTIQRLTGLQVGDIGSAADLATARSAQTYLARFFRVTADFTSQGVTYKRGDLLAWDTEDTAPKILSSSQLPSKSDISTIMNGAVLPDLPAEGSRDNKVPKFDGNVLGWEVDATATGGSGLDQAAVDARVAAGVQDWAEEGNNDAIPASKLANAPSGSGGGSTELTPVIVPANTTAISFGIQGQSTWPSGMSRDGGLSGTTYWRDYRDLNGLQFVIDSATVTDDININMADLMSLNGATGGRDETKSRIFEIINYRSQGGVTFSGGGISNIRPAGARLEPGYKGLVSLTPWKTSRWLLSLGAFAPTGSVDDAAVAAAVSNALPPFFGITPLPAGIEGGTEVADYPDHIDIVFTGKQTSKTISNIVLTMQGVNPSLNSATPISGINDPTEFHGILRFDIGVGNKNALVSHVSRHLGLLYLTCGLTITFTDGTTHSHVFSFAIRNSSFGPHPVDWAARGNNDAIPASKRPFDPTLIHSGNVGLEAAISVDAGFNWPSDADYLAVAMNLGSGPLNPGEQIVIIRNPRLGSGLLDSTPVTATTVGGDLRVADNTSIDVGFILDSGTVATVFFGRTSANRAVIQSTNAGADPTPLTVARI